MMSSINNRPSKKMMKNPYICTHEIDVESADHSIISYSVFTDESFILILLLSSNGETHAYLKTAKDNAPRKKTVNIKKTCGVSSDPLTLCIGSQASFVIFGLSNGNILVTPMKTIIDVTWGGSSWSATSLIEIPLSSTEPCLAVPTCVKYLSTNYPPRNLAVMANKGGHILIIDLQLRRCDLQLRAPQTISDMDILIDENSIELLVTGFTGAQWIIPIERNGQGIREVLTTCVPADLEVLGPPTTQFFSTNDYGVIELDTKENIASIYTTIHSISHSSNKKFSIPPTTWMIHSTDNVLFAVSSDNVLRSSLHFGCQSVRLEYSVVNVPVEWRPLGIISIPQKPNCLPGVFLVNERGLVRIEQDPKIDLVKIASEFLFRVHSAALSKKLVEDVANACRQSVNNFSVEVIPNILIRRKSKGTLAKKDLKQLLALAKHLNLTMSNLLETFDKLNMGDQLLHEVIKEIETNPTKNSNLLDHVIDLFVKKVRKSINNTEELHDLDLELCNFLRNHEKLLNGGIECAKAGMWNSAQILIQREMNSCETPAICTAFLKEMVLNGNTYWKDSTNSTRLIIMSLVCRMNWSELDENDGAKVCALLCAWQRDVNLRSYHEMCLRVAKNHMKMFKRPCQILTLVSSIYLSAQTELNESCCSPHCQPIAAGCFCGAAIANDGRILVWGYFKNVSNKEKYGVNDALKGKNEDNVDWAPLYKFPHLLDYPGSQPRAIACGMEHILVLSSTGKLSSWGHNQYGQCGVGHTMTVSKILDVEGEWGPIVNIACGSYHSAFICEDGSLWTFGYGFYGQLGHGRTDNGNATTPKRVDSIKEKVVQVVCGKLHTVALTGEGKVYVCGCGLYGQLGSTEEVKKSFDFVHVDFEGCRVEKVATNSYQSLCLTTDNRIFEWGRAPDEQKMKLMLLKRLRAAQITCELAKDEAPEEKPKTGLIGGRSITPRMNLNLPKTIPREDFAKREVKHDIEEKIDKISSGMLHFALVTVGGSLYVWGKSLEFQLGNQSKTESRKPLKLEKPEEVKWESVSCGFYHTIASTSDGEVYGWGRNEKSQCGSEPKRKDVAKKFYFHGKDGRKIPVNNDKSMFKMCPSNISELKVLQPNSDSDETLVDDRSIAEILRSSDSSIIQAASKHLCSRLDDDEDVTQSETSDVKDLMYDGKSGPLCSSTALVHLIAGDVKRAITIIEYLRGEESTPRGSLQALSSLVWDVMANHEDVQTKSALTAAFRHLPMSESMRKGKQIAQLWPAVWDNDEVQNALSIDEKIAILDGFTASTKSSSCTTISSSSLEVSPKLRVYSQCSHVEPAVVSTPTECSACADEWTEKVRATLGTI